MHAVNFQQIGFEEEREEEALARNEGDTKLTGLFNLQDDIRSQNVLYAEIISTDSWDKKQKQVEKTQEKSNLGNPMVSSALPSSACSWCHWLW